jgi:hypothetical protein
MTGAIAFHTKFVLSPGDRNVVEKLRLAGCGKTVETSYALMF